MALLALSPPASLPARTAPAGAHAQCAMPHGPRSATSDATQPSPPVELLILLAAGCQPLSAARHARGAQQLRQLLPEDPGLQLVITPILDKHRDSVQAGAPQRGVAQRGRPIKLAAAAGGGVGHDVVWPVLHEHGCTAGPPHQRVHGAGATARVCIRLQTQKAFACCLCTSLVFTRHSAVSQLLPR